MFQSSIEDLEFLRLATLYVHELPPMLRHELNAFRLLELDSACVISGYPIDDERIGPTPAHWKDRTNLSPGLREEIFFFLCSCLLGDPIGWATQQDGRLMHDVFPIKEHEKEQLGSGSEELLTWHTEDAFHALRTDYLGLMCLRNRDAVETTYASVSDLELDDEVVDVLRQPRFPIRPDRSHLPHNADGTRPLSPREQALLERSYEWIEDLDAEPDRVAVLFGDRDAPYLRLDPYFMDKVLMDPQARSALDSIIAAIDKVIIGYALHPGEVIFLGNYKAVHGRLPFQARFDGTDRWLKRLNIARDMRKSRDRRLSVESRIIH